MKDGEQLNSEFNEDEEDEINIESSRIQFSFLSLFYEINQLHIWGSLFFFPRLLMVIIQLVSLSYWPLLTPPQSDGRIQQTDISLFQAIIEKITVFVSFSLSTRLEEHTNSRLVIILIICAVLLFLCIFTLFYIRRNVRIPEKFLYLSSFIFQIIAPVFYLPTILTFSVSFLYLSNGNIGDIFMFIGLFVLAVLYSILMYFLLSSFTYFASPSNFAFASFDNLCTKLIYLNGLYIIIFSYISIAIGNWFQILSISLHIIFTVFMIYLCSRFPFISFNANLLVCSFFIFSFSNDVFSLLWALNLNIPDLIKVFIPIAIFIISFIVLTYILPNYLDHLREKITNSTDFISSFKLRDPFDAKKLIRIGFSLNLKAIFDGTILLPICRAFDDAELWYIAASIFSFIPSQRDPFHYALSQFKKLSKNSFLNKSKYYSLKKLDQYRNFVATHEFDFIYENLKEVTHNAINSVNQFWLNTGQYNQKIDLKALCNVADQVKIASETWNEVLLTQPNEPSFLELYSTYQIECLGKIEKGVHYLLQSEKYQNENHQAEVDDLFSIFIITRPQLLKDGIVDEMGNLLRNAKDKKEEYLYHGKFTEGYYEIQDRENQMFQWAQHRVQLEKATSHYQPCAFYLFRFISIIAIIIWLALMICELVLGCLTFPHYNSLYDRSIDFIHMQDSFSISYSLLLLGYAESLGILFNKTRYDDRLDGLFDIYSIDPFNLAGSLDDQSKIAQQSIHRLLVGLADAKINLNEFYLVVESLTQSTIPITYCTYNSFTNSMFISERNGSLRQAVMALIWYQQSFDSKTELSKYDPVLCELHFLYYHIAVAIFDVIYKLDQTLDIHYDSDIKYWTTFIIAIDVISICLFIPFHVLPSILIRLEIRKTIKAIESISKEGALGATNSISKESTQTNSNKNGTEKVTTKTFYTSFILSCFIPYLLIIIVVILMNVAFILLRNTLKNDVEYQKKQHSGALRLPMISELLSMGILEVINRHLLLEYADDSQTSNRIINLISVIQENNLFYNEQIVQSHDNLYSLHFDQQCKNNSVKCIGLSQELDMFLTNSINFLNTSFSLNSDEFIDLFYIGSSDLHHKLSKSIELDTGIQKDIINKGKLFTVLLIAISIALLLLIIILSIYFDNVLLKILKTALLLIRHIPPPVIAESLLLIQLLKRRPNKNRNQVRNLAEIIFDSTSTPVIIVGDGFLIESVNSAFETTFGLTQEQLIGHSLENVIPKPESDELYYSSEEQGAYHLFEKMELAIRSGSNEPISYGTLCIHDENGIQDFISVKTTVYPVRENDTEQMDHLNFVCIIKPKSIQEQKQLQTVKNVCDALLNQLIPRDIANYTVGTNDFKFVTKNVTLIAVKVKNILELISSDMNHFAKIISVVENLAKRNPPFLMIKVVYDTIFVVGGLLHDSDIVLQSSSAVSLLFPLKELLNQLIPQNIENEKRFAIGVVYGGPVLSGIVRKDNPHFAVSGALFDEVSELCSACEDNGIIVSNDFKNSVVTSMDNVSFDRVGPFVNGQQTYLL